MELRLEEVEAREMKSPEKLGKFELIFRFGSETDIFWIGENRGLN